ncbi:TonB-dependent receptor domain-containing protein [Stieleria varia]|uniref:TonB-dependent receptor domain-containing protein n=1 Tax=Stieleria varia TaxID=2528005 RepID=UPI0018D1FCD3|nr:TonB-dependent receptor [Stieleria varia]
MNRIIALIAFGSGLLCFSITGATQPPTLQELPETVVEAVPEKPTGSQTAVPEADPTPPTAMQDTSSLSETVPDEVTPLPEPFNLSPDPQQSNIDTGQQTQNLDSAQTARPMSNDANRSTSAETSAFQPAVPVSRSASLQGETSTASSGQYGQPDLEFRPINRPGDLLELIPGVIATQHSGSGKANQYFVRGINLDHGTDFAVRVDGVPMNLPSHGHGQGYLDVNWLIPELIESVNYRLGPYSADIGDFSSAGSADIRQRRALPFGIASVTAGAFDYYRVLLADSHDFAGGTLLYAYETSFYDGPWVVPEDFHKFNGLLRWSIGDRDHGFSLSTMGYHSDWTATNQIPQRAVTAGLVDRFGSLDPSDGGNTKRFGVNAEYWSINDDVTTAINAYTSYYDMDLFSNFTFFLDDPINGDQIQQIDNRWYSGVNASQTYHRQFVDHTFGFQFRNDNVYGLELNRTRQRQLISQTRNDDVDQQSYSLYYVNDAALTSWARSTIGLRGDLYRFHNQSNLNAADSGTTDAGVFSPKLGLVFGPWNDSELFLNWGQSFHSNDSRGVNASVDPADPLIKSEGSEIGLRSDLTCNWNSTLAMWYLEIDSELLFVGDAGTTEAGPASRRFGVTWTNYYQLNQWLTADADYAFVQPRFAGGDRIPNAVENVLATGFTAQVPHTPWYGTFRLRHYGPAALIEDNSARSETTTVANLQLGYQTKRTTAAVDVFNVFNSKDNDITYFYESQPAGLPAAEDFHFHPVEPAMARASVTWRF